MVGLRESLLCVLLVVGGALLPVDGSAAEKVDRKAVTSLAEDWFDARPKTAFEDWDHARRKQLVARAVALGELPEGSLDEVVETIWKAVRKRARKLSLGKVRSGKGTLPTPYGDAWWYQSGRGGPKRGLMLGLHGGGPGAGDAGEAKGNWPSKGNLAFYPQGIRLIHDTWNSVHGERFALSLIELAKVLHDIDPDRVYSVGFSMGATGSMFLAGRHPDLLAGAIPGHGVLPAQHVKKKSPDDVGQVEHGPLPTLRNVAVYFYTGTEDVNCEPGTFLKGWRIIQDLKQADPEGYKKLRFTCHEGIAHTFPPGEPETGLKWILEQKRDPYPTTIVWEYNADPWPQPDSEDKVSRYRKQWLYWLYCQRPDNRMKVRVSLNKEAEHNRIDFEHELGWHEDFRFYLRPEMIDVSKATVVYLKGKEIWRGTPKPTYHAIFESFFSRMDRRLVFDRMVDLDGTG